MVNEFVVDGKRYISASRASKISGYNSDYIGQLCRKSSLDCRMVGRVWFVNEESLKNHKLTASQTPRGRIPFSEKTSQVSDTPDLVPNTPNSFNSEFNGPKQLPVKPPSSFSENEYAFRSAFQNSADFLDVPLEKKQSKKFFNKICVGVVMILSIVIATPYFMYHEANTNSNTNPFSFVTPKKIITLTEKTNPTLATIKNYKTETVDSLAYSATIFYSQRDYVNQKFFSLMQGVHRDLAYLGDFFQYTTKRFKLAFFKSGNGSGVNQHTERTGIVVLPSSNDAGVNSQVKEYVVNSFSDETEITPDEYGNSGLIRPIFKDESDQEYLYVIVPVKESQQ